MSVLLPCCRAAVGVESSAGILQTCCWAPVLGRREEVEAGETQLFLEGGRPLRRVAVLNVFLKNSRGQTLYEAEQVRGWVKGGGGSGGCASE